MNLREHLLDIKNELKRGTYDSEAAISQGIVQRLLQTLDWPIFDPKFVYPQYKIDRLEVDFALCSLPGKPLIFIEVKKADDSEKTNEQLVEYALHVGVPIVIVTDGQEWHFYLSDIQGDYQDRCIYKLHLLTQDVEESVFHFQRYLDFTASRNKSNIQAAKQDYQDINRNRQIDAALPLAIEQLITNKDELLFELIADTVESLCSYRPGYEKVSSFLTRFLQHAFNSNEFAFRNNEDLITLNKPTLISPPYISNLSQEEKTKQSGQLGLRQTVQDRSPVEIQGVGKYILPSVQSKQEQLKPSFSKTSDTQNRKGEGQKRRREFMAKLRELKISLTQQKGVLYKTGHGELVGIATAQQDPKKSAWFLGLPRHDYDYFVLICETYNKSLLNFVIPTIKIKDHIPQLSYSHNDYKIHVVQENTSYYLHISRGVREDISKFLDALEVLR